MLTRRGFLWYIYRIAGNFRGVKLSRMAYLLKFADNIFADPQNSGGRFFLRRW